MMHRDVELKRQMIANVAKNNLMIKLVHNLAVAAVSLRVTSISFFGHTSTLPTFLKSYLSEVLVALVT